MLPETEPTVQALLPTHIEDLQLASSEITGARRRTFQAKMTLKYCAGSVRQADRVFGWGASGSDPASGGCGLVSNIDGGLNAYGQGFQTTS